MRQEKHYGERFHQSLFIWIALFFPALTWLCLFVPSVRTQVPSTLPPAQAEDFRIKEALSLYQAGDLEGALSRLRDAYRAAPDDPFAKLYLGLLLYQKDPAGVEAQRLMESVVDRFPANPDLILRLSDSYLATRNDQGLRSLLSRSRKARAADRRLALNVVYLLVRYDQLQAAGAELDALSTAPPETDSRTAADPARKRDSGEIAFIRGLMAASAGRKEDAMRQFQAADRQEFPPQDSPQMRMLAEALSRMEEPGLAAPAYQVYLSHFPDDRDAGMQLALAYLALPSLDRAQEQLRGLLLKAPDTPQANYYLGLASMELRKYEEARQYFERELKLDPGSYQSMAQLALAACSEGEDERCRQWLEKAAAGNPDWPDTLYVYGLLYNREGKYPEAVRSLEKALSQAPKNLRAHLQLSMAYLRSGDEARANMHRQIYEKLLNEHKARSLGEDVRRK